ncbi:MAG: phosphoenolpyruvate--protein phosphotransferase [Planctomycetaceae bacterium]|nr:phosphoenolpyruvate--protein phosphotransferase [Planctomycetaceae bacterium]
MAASDKEHLSLLCDVSEFAARLAGSADIHAYLSQIVGLVADHLHCDVCSIYLYDDKTQELVLQATSGLAPQSVGNVRMKISEGLTGMALRELRPVREQVASDNPNFKPFQGINEEPFDAFLAVPIQRGIEKIGVLVVQRSRERPFDDEDVLAVKATTSQLAGAIENARILMGVPKAQESAATGQRPPAATRMVKGQTASRGFAHGPAIIHDHGAYHRLFTEAPGARPYSMDDLQRALDATAEQLQGLQERLGQRVPEMASLIFEAHLMMLKDTAFIGEMRKRIEDGENPPQAVLAVGRKYSDLMAASPHAYMREKEHDVEDVIRRILANLMGMRVEVGLNEASAVIVAREMYPSDIVKLATAEVGGIVQTSGGVTSHVSILARSLHVPMVIADDPTLLDLPEGTPVVLDADIGNIYINPTPDIVERFSQRQDARRQVATQAPPQALPETTATADGTRIRLLANINLLTDIDLARFVGAEGVGLYRSEFPFLVRNTPPSEEEQVSIYRRLIEGFEGREVTFRTLDIGADKLLLYFDETAELNPAMGLRSIRFSFRHDDIFRQQLRAILRAGAGSPIRIMFPMISSVDDFVRAKTTLDSCMQELAQQKLAHNASPAVGVMVEVPSAVEMIDTIARRADFLCIGSNDLIQFLLAVDRSNEKVASYFMPHHPAVLRSLQRVAQAGAAAGCEVSICGEMAHVGAYLPFLIGIGVRALSLDPQFLPPVQQQITQMTLAQARHVAQDLLAQDTIDAVIARLPDLDQQHSD